MENNISEHEKQIKQIIDSRVKAIHDKDLNLLLAHHDAHVQSYDIFKPIQYSGSDKIKERAEKWFSGYKSLIGYDISDLSINASNDLAFCHYIYHIKGTLNDGGEVNMFVRCTICFKKVDNEWKIIHEHSSVAQDL